MRTFQQLKERVYLQRKNIFIVLMIVGGCFLRLYHLGYHDLWSDEAYVINKARIAPFATDLWSTGLKLSWDTPVYYLFMRLWLSLCSFINPNIWRGVEWILRFPSAVFGGAMLVLHYRFSRRLFDSRTVALVSLFFLAFSPFHLWYAQEARPYVFSAFITLLSSYFFYRFLMKKDALNLVGYVVSATVSLYTDYMSMVIVFTYGIFSLLQSRDRAKNTFVALLPLCLFLPWISLFLKRFSFIQRGFWVPSPSVSSLLITGENFIMGYNGTAVLYYCADFIILFTVISVCLRWKASILEHRELLYLILLSAVPVSVIFVVSKVFPLYLDRLFLVSTPYFYLLIAWAVAGMRHKGMRILMTIFLMITMMIAVYRYYNDEMYMPAQQKHHMGTHLKRPVRPLVRFLADNLTEHDYVWWGSFSCAFPLCVYATYLPEYRLGSSLAETMCTPFPSFLDTYESRHDQLRQRAFFVFSPGIINTSFKRPYTHEIFRNNTFFVSLDDALTRLEKGGRIFFLGYDWARSGSFDENSKHLKDFLDSSFPCMAQFNFDGVRLYVYRVPETSG